MFSFLQTEVVIRIRRVEGWCCVSTAARLLFSLSKFIASMAINICYYLFCSGSEGCEQCWCQWTMVGIQCYPRNIGDLGEENLPPTPSEPWVLRHMHHAAASPSRNSGLWRGQAEKSPWSQWSWTRAQIYHYYFIISLYIYISVLSHYYINIPIYN